MPAAAPAQQPAAAAATKAPAAAEPTKAPAAASAKPFPTENITISIWGGFPEIQPVYEAAAAEYKKLHPNVTVTVLTAALREFEQKMAATIRPIPPAISSRPTHSRSRSSSSPICCRRCPTISSSG